MKKIQLGILFGGRTCEHEVSVISALQLSRAVDLYRYDLYPIYINKNGEWFCGDGLLDLSNYREPILFSQPGLYEKCTLDITTHSGALTVWQQGKGLFGKAKTKIITHLDVIIPVMHGLHGEDGSLQGMLELADIPYSSTGIVGSSAGMDKIIMKQVFRGADIPVLQDTSILRSEYMQDKNAVVKQIEEKLEYPVFVKPSNLGSSIGISRADNREELILAIDLACEYDRRILIEKGLDRPIEVNCSVLGFDKEIRASVLEMPSTGGRALSFFDKYLRDGGGKGMASLSRIIPAPIGEEMTEQIKQLSKKVFRLLDCKGVVRIDWMIDVNTEELYITEINTIPGSMAFYLWNKSDPPIRYPKLIDMLVKYAIQAHTMKNENNYAFQSDLFSKMSLTGSKGSKSSV
ncbi:MAG: D-alanine--D-alanine ligase family protein [Eubacteriales bacterium]|nr:D-alanine--D-alanine ligase family protein [Eubacteriales bacterium]